MSRFAPVPNKPNCVSSRADPEDRVHYTRPFEGVTLAEVKSVVAALPRTELVEEADDYLHFVVRTAFLGFKDDVEFEVEGDHVHVRSASRVGYGDLGVNRKRVRSIRDQLGKKGV